jgi:hypothetical protein
MTRIRIRTMRSPCVKCEDDVLEQPLELVLEQQLVPDLDHLARRVAARGPHPQPAGAQVAVAAGGCEAQDSLHAPANMCLPDAAVPPASC